MTRDTDFFRRDFRLPITFIATLSEAAVKMGVVVDTWQEYEPAASKRMSFNLIVVPFSKYCKQPVYCSRARAC